MNVETEVLWLDENRIVSLEEVLRASGLAEAELLELVHAGAIVPCEPAMGIQSFSARVVTVARKACRLRDDLELEPRALALALKLLERVQDLENELARARAQLPRS